MTYEDILVFYPLFLSYTQDTLQFSFTSFNSVLLVLILYSVQQEIPRLVSTKTDSPTQHPALGEPVSIAG